MDLTPALRRWQEADADERAAEAEVLMNYAAAPARLPADRRLLLHLALRMLLNAQAGTEGVRRAFGRWQQESAREAEESAQEHRAEVYRALQSVNELTRTDSF